MLDTAFFRLHRTEALTSQGSKCAYCRDPLSAATATADHLIPRSKGGRDRKDNIAAACAPCNKAKGSMSVGKFVKAIKWPGRDAPWPIFRAWMRRKLNLRIERACRRILASVGSVAA